MSNMAKYNTVNINKNDLLITGEEYRLQLFPSYSSIS
jgi:hypothetical protein